MKPLPSDTRWKRFRREARAATRTFPLMLGLFMGAAAIVVNVLELFAIADVPPIWEWSTRAYISAGGVVLACWLMAGAAASGDERS